ncbi:galactitol-1-phosphate 5-dehydrogenase [Lentibacillus salicampi]|uniref:Galactitol-1-phosphate 5-dehydrogenase n=1 Tax=Lentibacillus salicampi TaxID=175306 RepID=A0A4Y9A7H7_9BACI|nr:galactitol-1-phosphate 5-dehydrogenase [Lentibacillus salicampi]TFJ91673.1 galactitol-1-phosphate 5-dehydrogenase [Lentibacillus salicampi]
MKALVLEDKQHFEVRDIEKPTISENQVLVNVSYCGVCGSDLDRYFKGKVHFFPMILGHEFSGVIEEVGDKVTFFSAGNRVAVAPLVPCDQCENCLRGKPSHCEKYSFIGSREKGAMAEYVAVDERNLIHVPEEVSLEEAALIEPLTVAMHGIERINFAAGSEAVIFGAGTIGMMTLLALKARGAGDITVIDINSEKLNVARELGATETVNSQQTDLHEYFANHNKPAIVFETAGVAQTQRQCIEVADHTGKVVYIGTATSTVEFPPEVFEQILRKELEIAGSWMSYSTPFPGYEWKAGLQYIKDGIIDVKPLIDEIFELEDKEKPFDRMKDPSSSSIKYLYKID